jgi:AcrR family transcriptional regulator
MDADKMPTKEKIMKAAAKLFSERGYEKVTTREIAKAIGINSASIYYHFTSKEDLLKSLYVLYTEENRKKCPDLNALMQMAETEPVHEVLTKSVFHFDDEVREMLDQILVTAAREICADSESENFIRENVFRPIESILKPLLFRMVELGRIEPFDIEAFIRIMKYYCFSAAALNNSALKQSVNEYHDGMSYIFSMIPVKG